MVHNAVSLSHLYVNMVVKPGDVCVDATAGNGHDTLFLSNLVGEKGLVYSFDIQEQAIQSTRKRLERFAKNENVRQIHDSHAKVTQYVKESITCMMFNLGYLPGGDHSFTTRFDSTKSAIMGGLSLLRNGGIICICAYWGDDQCLAECEELTSFLRELDDTQCEVLLHDYINEGNCPPKFFVIYKK